MASIFTSIFGSAAEKQAAEEKKRQELLVSAKFDAFILEYGYTDLVTNRSNITALGENGIKCALKVSGRGHLYSLNQTYELANLLEYLETPATASVFPIDDRVLENPTNNLYSTKSFGAVIEMKAANLEQLLTKIENLERFTANARLQKQPQPVLTGLVPG